MINMIRADAYRFFRTGAFYISLIILAFMVGTSVYILEPGYIGISGSTTETASSTEENTGLELTVDEAQGLSLPELRKMTLKSDGYPLDKQIIASNANLYYIFIFAAAIAVTMDFSGGSVKNTLTSAISRKKYFASKVIFVNIVCLAVYVLNNYLTYFADLAVNGSKFASSLGEVSKLTLMQLPPMLAFISIQISLAFMLRKTALFNTVVIPLVMVFQLILSILQMITGFDQDIMRYELQSMITILSYDPQKSFVIKSCLLCAGGMLVLYLLGYLSFTKSEIK